MCKDSQVMKNKSTKPVSTKQAKTRKLQNLGVCNGWNGFYL